MKKIKFISVALFILIGGLKFLPVSAQTPGADVQIDPSVSNANVPGASVSALTPKPGPQGAVSGGLKIQLPNSVATSDIRRDVQILPKKGTLSPSASQSQLSGAVSDETSAGKALMNGRVLSSGRNGTQTIPDMSRAAGESAAGAREVKALEVNVQKLGDARKNQTNGLDAGGLFHKIYDQDRGRHQWADSMAMNGGGIELPKIHPKSLTADVGEIITLAAKVDPISAVGLLLGSAAQVKTLLEGKQISAVQASTEIRQIVENLTQMGVRNHGVFVKRLVVAALDYAVHAASGRHYKEMADKGSAELSALNTLGTRSGRAFIKGESAAEEAIAQARDAALAHPEVLPPMPVVETHVTGSGAGANVVVEVRATGDMPSAVHAISKKSLLEEVALRQIETTESQALGTLPESKGNAIIKSAMPVKFWETFRKQWNQGKSFWVSFEIFGRWARGERDGVWAAILEFYYALMGRNSDMPTIRLNSDSLRDVFTDPRRSGLILQPV